jgi:hypothetical protein
MLDWLIGAGFSDNLFYTKSQVVPEWGNLYTYREKDIQQLGPYNIPSLPFLTKTYLDKILNSESDLPLMEFYGIEIGPPNEEYMLFRFVKIDLVTAIFDMLLHSSSDGKITDGLELLGDIYKTNQEQNQGFTSDQLFYSISKFSGYDFNNFFDAYVVNRNRLNIDYKVTDINAVSVFGDYSTVPLSIVDLSPEEFRVTGSLSQDSYMGLTSNLNILSIYVNTLKVEKLYSPWGEPDHIASFFVPKGNFQILVSTKSIPAPTPLPTSSLPFVIDGDDSDWSGYSPYWNDNLGDSLGGIGTDLKAIYIAEDNNYSFIMIQTDHDLPTSEGSFMVLGLNIYSQHTCGETDIDTNISPNGTLYAWAQEPCGSWSKQISLPGVIVNWGKVLEIQIPKASFINLEHLYPTHLFFFSNVNGSPIQVDTIN